MRKSDMRIAFETGCFGRRQALAKARFDYRQASERLAWVRLYAGSEGIWESIAWAEKRVCSALDTLAGIQYLVERDTADAADPSYCSK